MKDIKINLLKNTRHILINMSIFYCVGIFLHIWPVTLGLMKYLTPFVLFILGSFTLYLSLDFKNKRTLIWLFLCFIFTLGLEIIGVATGWIFGHYTYGDVLGFKILEVPLIIGFNWLIIIYGFVIFYQKKISNSLLVALLTALSCFIFDFIMEPVAMELDYWNWMYDKIPLQNYIAWFLIAFVFSLFYAIFVKKKSETEDLILMLYLVLQIIFFTGLRLYFTII